MERRLLPLPVAALLAFVPGGCSPQKPSGGAVASPPSPVAAVQPPAADRDDKDAQKRLEPERKDDSKEFLSDKSFKGFGVNGSVGGRLGNRMARGGGPLSALHWLARHQSPDGRWSSDGFGAACGGAADAGGCDGAGEAGYDVGVTGLALYAFLSESNYLFVNCPAAFADSSLGGRETLRSQGYATGNSRHVVRVRASSTGTNT